MKRKKHNRIIFIISSAVALLACVSFIISSFQDEIVFFYSPNQLLNEKTLKKVKNRKIRVGGLVVENSVKKKDALNISFKITDNKKNLLITYQGLVPDLFREGQGIIANGKYDQKNSVFVANELLVKHDEKYMPPEVIKNIDHQYKK